MTFNMTICKTEVTYNERKCNCRTIRRPNCCDQLKSRRSIPYCKGPAVLLKYMECSTEFRAFSRNAILICLNISQMNLMQNFSKGHPAAFLGSCRYKLPEIHEDREVYDKIFDILNKLNIEAFIYIGGNDSMDTIKKLSDYAIITGHPTRFIGCPKTIDNDLALTDHNTGIWKRC